MNSSVLLYNLLSSKKTDCILKKINYDKKFHTLPPTCQLTDIDLSTFENFMVQRLLVSMHVSSVFVCVYLCQCAYVCVLFVCVYCVFLCVQSSQVGKAVGSDCHAVLLLAALTCGFPPSTNVDLVLLVLTSNLKRYFRLKLETFG